MVLPIEESDLVATLLHNTVPCTIDDTVVRFTLNRKQELAVKVVLDHFTKCQMGLSPPQLKMAILGEPGVRKSVMASIISWYLMQHNVVD